jgi:hypothetical protein
MNPLNILLLNIVYIISELRNTICPVSLIDDFEGGLYEIRDGNSGIDVSVGRLF